MPKQILVTGGTGYIGSHTTVELQKAGFDVVIIDNLSNSDIKTLDGIKKITEIVPIFEKIDLTDTEKLNNFFEKYKNIEAVIHFASLKSVNESVEKPLLYYRNNLLSLINLLEAMKKFKKTNLVFSSSCTVYGQPDKLPVTEDAPIKKAESPYGNTKQISEDIITDTVNSKPAGLKSIFLRYFNPIGAHKSGFIGELPTGTPDNLVPYVTQTAIGIRNQIKVFGNDYNTPDGSGIRDYIHVVDLAKAHIIAIKRLIENKNKNNIEIFNLGTGKGASVLEIIKTFEDVNKIKLNYKIVGRRPGDIEKIWADPNFANSELGWKSEKTLADCLSSAWKWEKYYRKNDN
ncbi:UDP-glucose 4-epimerase GalE [Patescibacteria group bacterium]